MRLRRWLPATGAGGKSKTDHYAELISNADRRIASLQAETEALGLTKRLPHGCAMSRRCSIRRARRTLPCPPAQRAEIRGRAEDMAYWEIAAKKVKEAYDFARDGVRGFISDFRQGLQNGEGALQSFVNAASNLLDKLISKLEDELVDALMGAFGSSGGSGGGLLGSLMGIFGGGGTVGSTMGASFIANAKGGIYSSPGLSAYSNSVVSRPTMFAFAKGTGLMGEAGPEAIMPLSRGRDGSWVCRCIRGMQVERRGAVLQRLNRDQDRRARGKHERRSDPRGHRPHARREQQADGESSARSGEQAACPHDAI